MAKHKIRDIFLKCLTIQNLVDARIVSPALASQLAQELRAQYGIELRGGQHLDQRMKEIFHDVGLVDAPIVWMTGVIPHDSFEKLAKRRDLKILKDFQTNTTYRFLGATLSGKELKKLLDFLERIELSPNL